MLGVFVALLMLILSVVHFYWAVIPNSLPSTKVIPLIEGKPALHPTRLTTCVVAFFLALIAIFALELAFRFIPLPSWGLKLGGTTLALVFLLRALGDFRLVGFFKAIKNSEFACYDTRLYSPLCLILAIMFLILTWSH